MADGLALRDGVSMGVAVDGLDQVMRLADTLAKAPPGAVPEALVGKPAAILAVLMTAAEMRMGPMEALRGIHMIKGKAVLSSSLMLAQAIRAGVRIEWTQSTDTAVRARFTRPGYPNHEDGFTIEEAKRAGLTSKGGNWNQHPLAMLRARTISRALTAWAPDVLGAGAYVEGEIEADEPKRVHAPEAIDADVIDPVEADAARVIDALEKAQSADEAQAIWKGPRALIWAKASPGIRAKLEAAKEAAKARLTAEPDADERAAIEASEREAANA